MPTLAVAIDPRGAVVGASKARKAIRKVRTETKLLEAAQQKLALQMKLTGRSAASAGMGMRGMMGGMLGMAGVFKMVQGWSKFDTSLRRIQGVLGGGSGVNAQMKALEATARQLGSATSFTASEAADGMLMLSRSGMSAGEVVASTGAVLDLAKVAAIGLQESATLTADSLKQFGMDASRAREAADTLAFAANNANTDIMQLGEGLKLSGPIAAAAGMSLADTSVALGILADSGLKATLGGTGVRSMLASLGDPSNEAADALTRLGIDVDTLGETIQRKGGMQEIMQKLGPDVMGLTDAIRIFSKRGASSALILGKSTKRWKEFDKAIKNSDGTVRNSADLIERGLGDSFKQLGSAISEASLALGDSGLADALKAVVHWLTEGVRAITDWGVGMTKAGASAAILITTLGAGGLVGILFSLWKGFNKARLAAGGFLAMLSAHPIIAAVTAISALGIAMVTMSSDADFASQELIDFNKTLRDMSANLDSLERSWQAAVRFKDTDKQRRALSGLKSEIMKIGEMSVALEKSGGLIKDPNQFKELESKLKAMGIGGFGTHIAGMPSPGGGASIPVNQRRVTTLIGSPNSRLGQSSTSKTFQEIDPKDVSFEVEKILRVITLRIEDLRKAGMSLGEQTEKDVQDTVKKMTVQEKLRSMHVALTDDLNLERLALEKGEGVRDAYIDQLSVLDELAKSTGLTRDQLIKQHGAELKVLQEVLIAKGKVVEKTAEELAQKQAQESFAEDIGRAVVNPLVEALVSGDFSAVGQTMYQNLLSAILEEMVAKPAVNAIKNIIMSAGTTQASGGAWSGGVQRFAKGGVVHGPEHFGMAGGRTGLMGEAGPEAIMPLKRLAGGKLGVTAQGGGHTVNDNRTINIQVQDDAGFRRTMRQLDRDQARRLDRGTK